jgi:NADH-quinone oxidoreductase subunit E
VRGSAKVIDAIRERLKLTDKKITTDDMMYTFQTVSCLGACGLAPVLVVDDEIHGQVTPQQALALIDKIDAEEKENA